MPGRKKEGVMEKAAKVVAKLKSQKDYDPTIPKLLRVGHDKYVLLTGKPGNTIFSCSGINCHGKNVSRKTDSF
jgi:hypothetical protein